MKNYNCKNCGAPLDLHKCKCDYCGTFFKEQTYTPLYFFEKGSIPIQAISSASLNLPTFSTACYIDTGW